MPTTEILLYLSIPVISGIVGWATNWLALRMTFYPLEFIGVKPFLGWQGIIPAKAGVMAAKSVDLLTSKLLTVEDQFARIEPERVAKEMEPVLSKLGEEIIVEVMESHAPVLWESVPKGMKERIFAKAAEDLPLVVQELMEDVKTNINELFDLKTMVVNELLEDKGLLNQIFLQCGAAEFKFIERSGLYFGFLFGLVQMLVWYFFPQWWILPVAGLLVGWATNFLALKLIFEPLEPKKIGPFTFQGLFIKRQKEVAVEYSKIIAERILTAQKIARTIISGPASDRLVKIVQKHTKQAVDNTSGLAKPLFQITQGTQKYIEVKQMVANRFVEELPYSVKHIFEYVGEALDIEHTLSDKMQSLSPAEFVGVLRPAYQQDEWKLILTGAILGGLAGTWQLIYLFGGSLG